MEDLLTINGVTFPVPEGGFGITYNDKTNTYTSESGETTVDVIRENVCNISVSYNALTEATCHTLRNALKAINTVTYYDSASGEVRTIQMKAGADRISMEKQFYRFGLSIWSLSFSLEEL